MSEMIALKINPDGYAVFTAYGRLGITGGRTKTGRIRVLTAQGKKVYAYWDHRLRYATIVEAKELGFYGTGCRYIEEDEPVKNSS